MSDPSHPTICRHYNNLVASFRRHRCPLVPLLVSILMAILIRPPLVFRAHFLMSLVFEQSGRRARKAVAPIVPEVEEVEGVLTAWKMPLAYSKGGGEAMKGLYVLFHGCSHGPLDW